MLARWFAPRRTQSAIFGLILGCVACRSPRGEPTAETVDPTAEPVQQTAQAGETSFDLDVGGDHLRVTPRARYRIAARVLATERYHWGWRGRASPVDLALGWGTMADPRVDAWIDWYQRDRWYFWQWNAGSPYHNDQIRVQSANVHIVPASATLQRALIDRVDKNDVIALEGDLVDLDSPDGEHWASSTSRSDTGDRSCELMWVERLIVDGRSYR